MSLVPLVDRCVAIVTNDESWFCGFGNAYRMGEHATLPMAQFSGHLASIACPQFRSLITFLRL